MVAARHHDVVRPKKVRPRVGLRQVLALQAMLSFGKSLWMGSIKRYERMASPLPRAPSRTRMLGSVALGFAGRKARATAALGFAAAGITIQHVPIDACEGFRYGGSAIRTIWHCMICGSPMANLTDGPSSIGAEICAA